MQVLRSCWVSPNAELVLAILNGDGAEQCEVRRSENGMHIDEWVGVSPSIEGNDGYLYYPRLHALSHALWHAR